MSRHSTMLAHIFLISCSTSFKGFIDTKKTAKTTKGYLIWIDYVLVKVCNSTDTNPVYCIIYTKRQKKTAPHQHQQAVTMEGTNGV